MRRRIVSLLCLVTACGEPATAAHQGDAPDPAPAHEHEARHDEVPRSVALSEQVIAQAGIVTLRDESFRKDGRTIAYRRVELSARGVRLAESDDDDDVEIHITESRTGGGKKKAARKRGAELSALEGDADPELVEALRDWRSERARRTKVPAYRILTNKALAAIAAARPKSLDALAVIHGVGPKVLERHGPDILKIVRGS